MAAKMATSKQQKSKKTPNRRCRSRSASAKRPATASPKRTKASPWIAVYLRTRPGVMMRAAGSRRPSKSAAPRRAGGRNGVTAMRSSTKNHTATAAAPASPTRSPSESTLCRLMTICSKRLASDRGATGFPLPEDAALEVGHAPFADKRGARHEPPPAHRRQRDPASALLPRRDRQEGHERICGIDSKAHDHQGGAHPEGSSAPGPPRTWD